MSPILGSVHFCVTFVMDLEKSQVSRWHFQTPIMNNTGMNVPNITQALIWTHMASIKHHISYVCQIDPCTKPSVKLTFPDPHYEQNWHYCPKHHPSPHLDPIQIQRHSSLISNGRHWIHWMPLPEWDPLGSAKNAIQAHSNDPFTVENYCCLCLLVVFSTICWHISFEHSCPQPIFAIQPHDTKRLIAQHTRQKCILLHCNCLSSLDISSSKEATTNLSLKLMRVSMMFFLGTTL